MNTPMTTASLRLGRLLCHYNLISPDQLETALELQSLLNQPLGKILVEHSFISAWQLTRMLCWQRLLASLTLILNILFAGNARAQGGELVEGALFAKRSDSALNIERVIVESRTGWNLPTILNQADSGNLPRYKIVESGSNKFSFIFSDPLNNFARDVLVGEFQAGVDANTPGFRYQAAISKKAIVLKMKYQF